MTTSLRSPFLSVASFSISAIAWRRASPALASSIPAVTAALTRVGHVLDADQDVELEVGSLDLLGWVRAKKPSR